jgi:hypothetical protein
MAADDVEASAAQRLFPDNAAQKDGFLRRLTFGRRTRHDDALLQDIEQEKLPTKDIIREEVWRLLPGDQRRRILLAKDDLAFGLEGDDIMLDRVPLHEVSDVVKGDSVFSSTRLMFDEFDQDGDGVLTLQELVEGLAMYGFTPVQTRELFWGDGAQGGFSAKAAKSISRQDFDKNVNHIRDVASTVVIVRTQPDGYNSGNAYHLGHALDAGASRIQ